MRQLLKQRIAVSAVQQKVPVIAGTSVEFAKLWGGFLLLLAVVTSSGCAVSATGSGKVNDKDAAQFNAQLGAKYLQRGDLEQAREKLTKALEQDKNSALAHISYARLLQRIENHDEARGHFERAIELEPESADHHNAFGIFLCEIDETNAAVEQFVIASKNPYYKTKWFALDNAGLCLLDAGDLDGAENYIRDALRENPRFANALLHMSQLTYRQQRLTIADAYFGRFREYGTDTPASLMLGMKIRRDLGDTAGAKAYAGRLLDSFPNSNEAAEYLGRPL